MKKKRHPEKKEGLTSQQDLFCHYYVEERNGTQAAILAKYSMRTAAAQASRLLRNVNVRLRVKKLIEEQFARMEISAELVLKEILKLSTFDPNDVYDEEGNLLPIDQIPEPVRKAIASIEVEELFDGKGKDKKRIGFAKKIKFWDKKGALDSLGKYLKLFNDAPPPGPTVIFQDIKIEGQPADQLITDINNRLTSSFAK